MTATNQHPRNAAHNRAIDSLIELRTNALLATQFPLLALVGAVACNAADGSPQQAHQNAVSGDLGDARTGSDPQSDSVHYERRGPESVGFRKITRTEAELGTDGPLELSIWYPARASRGRLDRIDYSLAPKANGLVPSGASIPGHAYPEAEPKGEDLPVVLFSHGFGLSPEWYSQLAEHIASHGFVVLAPEHPDGEWSEAVVAATVERPHHLSATLDLAEQLTAPGGPFDGAFDLSSVAAMGHSYGGYSALALAGAQVSPTAFSQDCLKLTETDPRQFLCAPLGDPNLLADAFGLSSAKEPFPSFADSRVSYVVTLAGDAFLFGLDGLSEVEVPVLSIGGTADSGTPWNWGAQLTFDGVSSQSRFLLGLSGGEHMLPANSCNLMPWLSELPPEYYSVLCEDPAWDREAAHEVIKYYVTAFLSSGQPDQEAAIEALSLDAAEQWKGIVYAADIQGSSR